MSTVEIVNDGAIEKLTIPVPDGGGIVVMKGRNGSGKTTALNAVESLVSGKGSLPLRDGTKKGSVEGFGVTMTIGRSTRRKGEAEVLSLDGKFSVIDLVEPGIKSAEAADAKRIKALIGISAVEASDSALYEAAGGKDAYLQLASPTTVAECDIVSKVERFKRDLEKAARVHEDEAENHRGAAKMLELTEDMPDFVQNAEAKLEAAIVEHSKLETRKSERESALAKKEELARQLTELREASESRDVKKLDQRIVIHEGQLEAHANAIGRAREALAKAEAEHLKVYDALQNLVEARAEAVEHEERIAKFEAQLEESTPEPVTDEELATARTAIDTARQMVIDNERHKQMSAKTMMRNAEIEKLEQCQKKALELRESAHSLDEVMSNLVGDGPLRVEDGRLVTTTKRGTTYYAELSWGERWRMALEIAAKVVGDGGAIVVPQEAYEGLDPTNRAELNEIAKEVGVVIFTAEADDGEIRAEVL